MIAKVSGKPAPSKRTPAEVCIQELCGYYGDCPTSHDMRKCRRNMREGMYPGIDGDDDILEIG